MCTCSRERRRAETTTRLTGRAGAAPVWLRLVRQGNQFTGYVSANGTSWTTAGTTTVNMTAAAYVGLAVTSRMDSALSTATFTNLQVGTGTAPTAPTDASLRPLGCRHHGPTVTLAARRGRAPRLRLAARSPLLAGGNDICGTHPISSISSISLCRVTSRSSHGWPRFSLRLPWSKAGVMIRESLTGSSRHVMMHATGTEGWWFTATDSERW